MPTPAKFLTIAPNRARDAMTLMRTCEARSRPSSSATPVSVRTSSETTCSDRSLSCRTAIQRPRSSPTSGMALTSKGQDYSPYWNVCTAGLSSVLWLPTGTVPPALLLNSSNGGSCRMGAKSWFYVSRHTAPSGTHRGYFRHHVKLLRWPAWPPPQPNPAKSEPIQRPHRRP